jgi:hypothetical protein
VARTGRSKGKFFVSVNDSLWPIWDQRAKVDGGHALRNGDHDQRFALINMNRNNCSGASDPDIMKRNDVVFSPIRSPYGKSATVRKLTPAAINTAQWLRSQARRAAERQVRI